MKRIRGFGYVGSSDEEDELEETPVYLEQGFASEYITPGRLKVEAYTCPRCKRVLFEADVSLHGVIFVRCRSCKREVAIETKPLMSQIGFK